MESRVRNRQDRRGGGVVSVSHRVGIKLKHIIAGGRNDAIQGGGSGGGAVLGKYPQRAKMLPTYFSRHLSLAERHVMLS